MAKKSDGSLRTLFQKNPEYLNLFLENGFACSFCPFNIFCTLENALSFYAYDPEAFDKLFPHSGFFKEKDRTDKYQGEG